MKQDTKFKIIEAGAKIIHHKGFNHTGIQEVLNAANVPKGSFYFYFNNKEDFGMHVIEFFNDKIKNMLSPFVEEKEISPVQRLEKIFNWYIQLFEDVKFQNGCPIGNLGQEMGDLSTAFREKLSESVDLMVKIYKGLLDEALENGEIPVDLDTNEAASFIVTSWQGALIRMKIDSSCAPLINHRQFILQMLTP